MGYRNIVLVIALAMAMVALPIAADDDVFPMADTAGPTVEADRTPNSATLDQPIEFNFTVTDETGVQNATVDYYYQSGPIRTLTLNRTSGNATNGTWATVFVPSGYTGFLSYIVYVYDTLGNYNMTQVALIQLNDIHKPELEDFTYSMSGTATTGDSYKFFANVSDNVRMNGVRIHYRVGSPPFVDQNVTMEPMAVDGRGNGLYVLNVTVHDNTTDAFVYTLWARDTSNNIRTLQDQVSVRDNDRPEITDDLSDSEGTTGDPFRFEVEVRDNVGIDVVKVFWAHTGTTPKNQTMTPTQVDAHNNGTIAGS